MTRREAEQFIARIRAGEVQLHESAHAREQLVRRAFTNHDLTAVLRSHVLETAPKWSELHRDFEVSLRGKCLRGRPTRIILGLRQDGACILVTIMVIGDKW